MIPYTKNLSSCLIIFEIYPQINLPFKRELNNCKNQWNRKVDRQLLEGIVKTFNNCWADQSELANPIMSYLKAQISEIMVAVMRYHKAHKLKLMDRLIGYHLPIAKLILGDLRSLHNH